MSSSEVTRLVQEGKDARKAGNIEEARNLFMQAVELDQYHKEAWLWLSDVVETNEDKRTCLENVLAIDPDNQAARKGIDSLSGGADALPPSLATPVEAPPAEPAPVEPPPVEPAPPSSAEWSGIATSSVSSTAAPPEMTGEDYDNWVNQLGIGSGDSEQEGGGSDVSPFTGGPFSEDMFNESDDNLFTSGPFDSAQPDTTDLLRDAINQQPGQAGVMSPGAETDFVDDDELLDSDLDMGSLSSSGGSAFIDDVEDDLDEGESFLARIPSDIKPTRLPGTIEGQPLPLMIALGLLVILNVGAALFLVYQLVV
jgi:hypothetical protein